MERLQPATDPCDGTPHGAASPGPTAAENRRITETREHRALPCGLAKPVRRHRTELGHRHRRESGLRAARSSVRRDQQAELDSERPWTGPSTINGRGQPHTGHKPAAIPPIKMRFRSSVDDSARLWPLLRRITRLLDPARGVAAAMLPTQPRIAT